MSNTSFTEPDFIVRFFEAMGITRLPEALDEGTVAEHVSDDDLASYARVAAMVTGGPPMRTTRDSADPDSDAMTDAIRQHVAVMLVTVLSDEGSLYSEVDGEPYVRTPFGTTIKVDENMLRHWEWLLVLLNDQATARRLLDTVPAAMRAQAEAAIDGAWDMAFSELVNGTFG